MKKRKVVPVGVPWQVSPSQSDLKLAIGEEQATLVSFLANAVRGDTTTLVRIVVIFERCRHARYATHESSRERGEGDLLDWRGVPGVDLSDLEGSRARFFNSWRSSGLCPSPGMYEVLDAAAFQGQKEYLILGHDSWVWVTADSWRWETSDGRLLDTDGKDRDDAVQPAVAADGASPRR